MQRSIPSYFVIVFGLLGLVLLLAAATSLPAQQQPRTYAGFDRNLYPGDDTLAALRRTFAFTGYWLNRPPGETNNTWTGKRELLLRHGFGFAVLFNGHIQKELQAAQHPPAQLGAEEATLAIAAAKHEGFPPRTILFLDLEEGGRLLPEQAAYLFAWMDGVTAGGYRAGVYCSGIPVPDGPHQTITTAQDITSRKGSRHVALWVANDVCPPAPGCTIPPRLPSAITSGTGTAILWQYAQSPRRKQFAASCPGYSMQDNECYAPAKSIPPNLFLDLNTATSPDPSSGH